ncbi:MAG: DNA polymerase, partial [Aestuariivirgaceae bacterium]
GEIEPSEIEVKHWSPPVADVEPEAGGDDAEGLDVVDAIKAKISMPVDYSAYETVTEMADLERWIAAANDVGYVAVDTETTSLDAMQADLVGVCLSVEPGKACYIPVGHRAAEGLDFGGSDLKQLPMADVVAALKPLLENPAVMKIGQNLKYDLLVLIQQGIDIGPFDDTMLLSYALDSGRGGHGMDDLAERHLGIKPISFKEVAGTGKSQVTFDLVPMDKATAYAAEDADITLRLWLLLKARLVKEHRVTVYETLERPLSLVLAAMEREGILVDRAVLARLSGDFAKGAAVLEEQAHKIADDNFNLGSPKQLGEILFGKLNLPGGKKTATGAWSTDSQVLEDLAREGVELARAVLDWRQLSKLRSTYTDALPEHINPDTGRVHTSYAMAATSTGRLASTDPNLQNIPVRTEEGRKIRT